MQVGELFVALGFEVDDKKLKGFNDEIKSGAVGLLKMVGVMSGAAFAVNAFVSGAVQTSVQLKNFREETGFASDNVERFYNVIGRLNSNVTLDKTVSAFRALSDTISQAKFGKGAIGEAGQLGLNNIGAMNPMQVIESLRANYSRNTGLYGELRTRDLMSELGLTSDFIQAIKATNSEFDLLFNKPILGTGNRARLEEVAEAQKALSFQWQLLRGELSAEISDELVVFLENIIPAITNVTRNFKSLSVAIRDYFDSFSPEQQSMIIASAVTLGAGIALAFAPVLTALGGIMLLMNKLGDMSRSKEGFTAALAEKVTDFGGFFANIITSGDFDLQVARAGMRNAPSDFSRAQASGELTVNNLWNISSSGDVMTLSDLIQQKQKRSLDVTLAQQSRGGVQ